MAGGDIILVSSDKKRVVLVDVKGRYYLENSSNVKNTFVEASKNYPPYKGKMKKENEDYMKRRLGNLPDDTEFVHVTVVLPTDTEYMTASGELISRGDKKSIVSFFDQFGLK